MKPAPTPAPIPIIYPLHPRGGKLRDDTELRYSLRSLHRHFKQPFEVVIVGRKLPAWITGVRHIEGRGLKSSLQAAARAYPDGFFWMYDDCCLLRNTDAALMQVTPACKNWSDAQTGWSRQLEKIHQRLKAEDYPAWDYSRPHGPYWFDQAMVDEGFADWPGMKAKFPWESWILSKRDWPRRHGVVKQYYGPFRAPPGPGMHFMNYNDAGNTPQSRCWLQSRFPEPSPFERAFASDSWSQVFFMHVPKTAGKSVLAALGGKAVVESHARHMEWGNETRAAWQKAGMPPIVACVREPLARAISTYRWFKETDFPERDRPHRVLRALFRGVSFSDFWERFDVEYIATTIKHLRPQADFLGDSPVTLLMRHETIAQDFAALAAKLGHAGELPVVNVSTGEMPVVTPAAERRIREFYQKDYEAYYQS